MGLLDVFSPSSGQAAAKREAAARKKIIANYQESLDKSIKGYKRRAPAAVTQGKTEAQKFYEENLPKQVGALTQAKTEATGLLGQGTEKAAGYYTQGLAPLQQQYEQDQTGRQAYLDYLNLTPGGAQRTLDRFNYSPMTQQLLGDLGETTQRYAASGGYLRSGATPVELQKQAYGLLAPQWESYGNRLEGFNPNAQGLASQLNAIGNVYNVGAANQANLAANLGPQLANAYSGYAANQAGVSTNAAGQLVDVYGKVLDASTNAANTIYPAMAQNVTDYNRNVYGAQQGAYQNQLGLATALINAGGTALGGKFA
jgi:hypothetical protein